ncbi:DUF58 domain-containing protein [Halobacterium jilantaiense]|uniref:Conserved repeat domain-containing protein n=1 Tax=Halobacterium jilantaiense TaxID=355548 RepID=A0A1I0MFB4_9EURY|nr:DUF58 domain-containing protein [Halobacterium jilantaiense]SEV87063.1 conserved repeat domain-containing protein [Halobacterium jilantaiense]
MSRDTGGLLATLALAAAGVASGQRVLFVAAAIPLAFVVFAAVSTPRDPGSLDVERTLSASSPLPGDRVAVTLTVENTGDAALTDVRVADAVPEGLRVVGGATGGGFALAAGDTATVEYEVVADRGQFPFGDPTVRLRGTGGATSRTANVPADGDASLDCQVAVADIPLRRQTTQHAGSLPTDTGGPGIEFHSTRDYQPGDPVSRIDWRQYAKTGDLTTVNYRERRAAAVVLAVDARADTDVTAREGAPSGAALSAYAAAQAVEPLETAGHQVGLAVFGLDDPVADAPDPAWVPPGTGDAHHARLAAVLDAAVGSRDDGRTDSGDGAESDTVSEQADATRERAAAADGGETTWLGGDTDARVRQFAARVDPGTQVVVCSPVFDDFPVALARRLAADDHRVTAVSPDVTATDTPGRTLAAADRVLALDRLRATGAQVVDWSLDESLASAVSRATTAVTGGGRQ